MATPVRSVTPSVNFESRAWKFMRYSGILLIPLVWIHVLLQDVIVGVHDIDLEYVLVQRWSNIGVQIYDILLLAFAFSHGMNGLRQVINDFIRSPRAQKIIGIIIFVLWIFISFVGAVAIIAAASKNLGG